MFTKITNKVLALVLGSLLFFGVIITTIVVYMTYHNSSVNIAELEKTLRNDFDVKAKYEVQTAVSLLNGVYNKYQKGDYFINGADQAKRAVFLSHENPL